MAVSEWSGVWRRVTKPHGARRSLLAACLFATTLPAQSRPQWSVRPDPAAQVWPRAFAEAILSNPTPRQTSSGAVFLLGSRERELWHLAPGATRAVRVARPGEGPSELSSPASTLTTVGDSALIIEQPPGRRKLTVVRSDGRVARTSDLPVSQHGATGFVPLATASGQELMVLIGGFRPLALRSDAVLRDSVTLGVYSDPTGSLVPLARLPGTPLIGYPATLEGRPLTFSGVPPLAPRSHYAAGTGLIAYGDSEWDSVLVVNAVDHRISAVVRLPWSRRAVAAPQVRRALDASLKAALGPNDSARLRAELSGAAVPRSEPMFTGLLISDRGELWVERFRYPHEHAASYTIFSRRGEWIADLTLPAGLRLAQVTGDFILGLRDAPDGSPALERWMLSRVDGRNR